MTDHTRRALRVFLQGLPPGALVALLVAFGLDAGKATALMAVLTPLSSLAYNLLESAGAPVPVKRQPPSP